MKPKDELRAMKTLMGLHAYIKYKGLTKDYEDWLVSNPEVEK